MGAINAFGEFLTPAVYVAVLSFLAYVIGMLLMVGLKAGSYIRLGRKFSLPYVSSRDRAVIDATIESAFHRARVRRANGHEIEREFGLDHMIKLQIDHDILRSSNGGREQGMDGDLRNNALRQLKEPFFDEIVESIPALAIKLQDKNQLLYGSYDRDKSESSSTQCLFAFGCTVDPVPCTGVRSPTHAMALASLRWRHRRVNACGEGPSKTHQFGERCRNFLGDRN